MTSHPGGWPLALLALAALSALGGAGWSSLVLVGLAAWLAIRRRPAPPVARHATTPGPLARPVRRVDETGWYLPTAVVASATGTTVAHGLDGEDGKEVDLGGAEDATYIDTWTPSAPLEPETVAGDGDWVGGGGWGGAWAGGGGWGGEDADGFDDDGGDW